LPEEEERGLPRETIFEACMGMDLEEIENLFIQIAGVLGPLAVRMVARVVAHNQTEVLPRTDLSDEERVRIIKANFCSAIAAELHDLSHAPQILTPEQWERILRIFRERWHGEAYVPPPKKSLVAGLR